MKTGSNWNLFLFVVLLLTQSKITTQQLLEAYFPHERVCILILSSVCSLYSQ